MFPAFFWGGYSRNTRNPVTFWANKNLSSQQNGHPRPSAQPLVELKKTQGSHPHSWAKRLISASGLSWTCFFPASGLIRLLKLKLAAICSICFGWLVLSYKGDHFPPCAYSKGRHRIPQEFQKPFKTNKKALPTKASLLFGCFLLRLYWVRQPVITTWNHVRFQNVLPKKAEINNAKSLVTSLSMTLHQSKHYMPHAKHIIRNKRQRSRWNGISMNTL